MTNQSIFKSMSPDEIDSVLSQFLVDSWSYSKVTTFARNEKAFEMSYIYNHKLRKSATSIAGNAYHKALEEYFKCLQESKALELSRLEKIAFDYIDEQGADTWKIQKTTPTVEDCRKKAYSSVTSLLHHFYSERPVYDQELKEILDIEVYCNEFLTINGVDIPMPCHAVIDLVIRTHDDRIVLIDHKSKSQFTDDQEVAMLIGMQAITYIKSYESKTGNKVDEVWFIENKVSTNKNGDPQLNAFKIQLNNDIRRLYEALLYEPLKRMIEAVSDPDHIYVINPNDNFVDMAELYEHWARTQIAEVEEFNIAEAKKELISKRLKKVKDVTIATVNPRVIKEFQRNAAQFIQYDLSKTDMTQEQKIEHILRTFGIIVRVAHTFNGYSSNTFLVEVSAGVKVASISSHKLDIASALDVSNVRILRDLIVYEGKAYLAIECTKKRDKDLMFDKSVLDGMKIPLGKDNFNRTVVWDLNNHSTPHILVCGATGSGKSVSIRSTIEYAKLAGVKDIVILDPKFEFTDLIGTKNIKLHNEILDIENAMIDLVKDMNDRVRNGIEYKTLVIFDEFADALSASRSGNDLKVFEMVEVGVYKDGRSKLQRQHTEDIKSLEENLRILTQKGRSVGFRVIAVTQRASVKVITGDAKVNFPVQICFRVPKETDSRVVIDEAGAESLAGMGDGLIKSPEYQDIVRFQAYYKPSTIKA